MKYETTVKRGVEPWTTRFNLTGRVGRLSVDCVEMTLYGLPAEMLAMMKEHDVKVTLETVQTREERLREARIRTVDAMTVRYAKDVVDAIERVDAEFAKGEG